MDGNKLNETQDAGQNSIRMFLIRLIHLFLVIRAASSFVINQNVIQPAFVNFGVLGKAIANNLFATLIKNGIL